MLRRGCTALLRASSLRPKLTTPALQTYTALALEDEYSKEPEYPAIQSETYHARLLRKRESWYDHINGLHTIEEKLMALNMPRYYGYKSLLLPDNKFQYNCLPFVQHSTRTAFRKTGLPEYYAPLATQADTFLASIREDVKEAIAFETLGYTATSYTDDSPQEQLRQANARIVNQINRVILNALSADVAHLNQVEIDMDPRHEAFWFVGGISPPTNVQNIKKRSVWQKDFVDEPVNRQFQYLGQPLLTVRHEHPLPVVKSTDTIDDAAVVSEVPRFKHDPRTIGFSHDYRHGTTIPGFWPGAPNEFGVLSYLSRCHLATRNPKYGAADNQESLHAQAILASFAWLLGQACYQGFSIFADPTYPLTNQTIITDGQYWSFYVYQLNTTQIHQDAVDTNPKANQCWGTDEMQLYDHVNADGTVAGFNDTVLRHLVQFYLNRPTKRSHPMKPLLGVDEQRVADIADPKRREFLESRYKHLVADRPRHRLVPEIYNWEKIYKVDNNTMPLKPKRRFFELGVNPYQRRLDEHAPVYIPKAVRPEGPRSRKRFEKTFYP